MTFGLENGPMFNPGGGMGGAYGVTGSPATGWTFPKTAESGVAEIIATFGVDDNTTAKLFIENAITTTGRVSPRIRGYQANHATTSALTLFGEITSGIDSGTLGVGILQTRLAASAPVTTRPLWEWVNGTGSVLAMLPLNTGANSCLSWGTQTGAAPGAFSTRPVGTRIVTYASWNGSTAADHSMGVNSGGAQSWYLLPGATSTFSFGWYAGAGTNIATLRGDGLLTTTGGRIVKVRSATATPVTVVAGTDEVIFCNVAASAAVAATLPANVAGQRFTFKDAIGTANVGNITITPTAGLIDGAATLVINTAYGKAELVGDGTNWFTV